MNRRDFLYRAAALSALPLTTSACTPAVAAPRFKIGACDWSIGKLADVGALELAREIGLDGVQVSLGTVADDMHLRQPNVQQAYLDAAATHGVEIGGIAIGALNQVPYKSDSRAEQWVGDSIDVAKAMGVNIVLLAFFSDGDVKGDDAGQEVVIQRLRDVAPAAEAAGITLGLETWLSADEHRHIIDAVGSPNIQVYYDVANSNHMGYDIYAEIRDLGDLICEVHLKENGFLLGEGRVDFPAVKAALDDIGYGGWMQIEGAVPNGAEILPSYQHNNRYVRSVFHAT
ncbi:MAG: hypothetical protein RhofKO_35610 [Rhodothermales bacterium]